MNQTKQQEEVVLEHLKLTDEGRPLKPRSIFIGIQRASLPSRERIDLSLRSGEILMVPARFLGRWELLVGVVRQVRMFTDGMLVLIDPKHENSMLKNWPCAPLWVPHNGTAGVLATWT